MYQRQTRAFLNEPHGETHFKWQGDILIVNAVGPFNIEGVQASHQKLKEFVAAANKSTWYRLDYADDNTFGDLEVIRSIGKSFFWCFENGCKSIASVTSNSLQRTLFESFLARHDLNLLPFDYEEDALDWIQSQKEEKADSLE